MPTLKRNLSKGTAKIWIKKIIEACFTESAKNNPTLINEFMEQARDWYQQGYCDREDEQEELFQAMGQELQEIVDDANKKGLQMKATVNLLNDFNSYMQAQNRDKEKEYKK